MQWRLRKQPRPAKTPSPALATHRLARRLAALALQVAFVIITLSLVVFLPESPRWLAAHGQVPAARDVLWRLDHGHDEKTRTISVDVQMNEILGAIELERKAGTNGSFKTCFTMGEQRFFHRVSRFKGYSCSSYFCMA